MHQRFDRKTLRTEQEKKITLGHKEDDQEEEQIWQQTADVLEEMIKETRSRLATLMKELEQAKEKAADLKNSAAAVQKEYDKIMSWADLYAGSSIEGKKMILRQLIDRVNIGRDFEIEVEFKISVGSRGPLWYVLWSSNEPRQKVPARLKWYLCLDGTSEGSIRQRFLRQSNAGNAMLIQRIRQEITEQLDRKRTFFIAYT